MARKKTVIRIVIAVLLMVVTGLLPFLAAFWQDHSTLGKSVLGDSKTVVLDFGKGFSGTELLVLMDQGDQTRWQVIDPAAASMTVAEAEQAARLALEPYQAAGLIPDLEHFALQTADARVVSIPTGLAGVVWVLTFATDANETEFCDINLTLEDSTGKLTALSFGCEERIPEPGMEEKLRTFASLYFGQMGITDHTLAEVDELADSYIGETAIAQRYRFYDEQYGAFGADLYLYQFGFFTDFSS